MTDEAFYVPDGDEFVATDWTRGPWDPRAQHAGPPAALMGRAIERLDPAGFQVARFTIEILKPVPIARLHVDARAVQSGRRVQFAEATLTADDRVVARASAWRIRVSDEPLPATEAEPLPFPLPEDSKEIEPFDVGEAQSYFRALDWKLARGHLARPGPASVWMRTRVPLVAGEPIDPLSRALVVADSGNGISATVDIAHYMFINTELSVHLHRMARGEWVCLDAVTRTEQTGIGLASSILWDEHGRLGTGAQSLLIAPH
jgi:hypothetical protein